MPLWVSWQVAFGHCVPLPTLVNTSSYLCLASRWLLASLPLIRLLRTALLLHGIQTESSELGAAADGDADGSDAAARTGVVEEVQEA